MIEFNSRMQKEAIERAYESKVKNKFFKLTWHHWGLLVNPDEVAVQKTWILGAHGQVWFYTVYANNKISPLETHLIFEGDMIRLGRLLDNGFDEQVKCADIVDGEGFEMVRFKENGKIRHKFCGSIWGNDYLKQIAERVDYYVMRKWVLVTRKKVW